MERLNYTAREKERDLTKSVWMVCVHPPGNNQRTGRPSNNGPPPHNWTVLWEPSTKAPGKGGGCLEVLHCSCWMMGIMGVCDAGCSFFFFFVGGPIQHPEWTCWRRCSLCCRNNRAACLFEGHRILYWTHRYTIQEHRSCCMSNLYTAKKARRKHIKSLRSCIYSCRYILILICNAWKMSTKRLWPPGCVTWH